jgi:hypothetical protein
MYQDILFKSGRLFLKNRINPPKICSDRITKIVLGYNKRNLLAESNVLDTKINQRDMQKFNSCFLEETVTFIRKGS